MRDIILTIAVLAALPYIISRPQLGIYTWSWLSYMNPHRLTWSFAYSLPYAQIVGIVTIISILFWKEKKRIPNNPIIAFWLLLLFWMFLTTIFAMYPDYAWTKLWVVIKIQLFAFLTIVVIKTKKELDILIWVIILSIGFYSVKGGVFTILTAGEFRVWGPPASYIEDNNSLAIASFMILPMMYYLWMQTTNKLISYLLIGMMLLTIISAFGSYSRSAYLAAGATGFFLWLKTPHKLLSGICLIIIAVIVFNFMPEAWHERMATIAHYQEDGSAMGRISAWKMALNVANLNLLGAGYDFWGPEAYQIYSSNPADWTSNRAAHSIYFTMLGEHGWPGLILFFLIFFSAWNLAGRTANLCGNQPDKKWIKDLSQLLQVSLVAYASGGAFLNLSYYDLPWHIVTMILIAAGILASEGNHKKSGFKNA